MLCGHCPPAFAPLPTLRQRGHHFCHQEYKWTGHGLHRIMGCTGSWTAVAVLLVHKAQAERVGGTNTLNACDHSRPHHWSWVCLDGSTCVTRECAWAGHGGFLHPGLLRCCFLAAPHHCVHPLLPELRCLCEAWAYHCWVLRSHCCPSACTGSWKISPSVQCLMVSHFSGRQRVRRRGREAGCTGVRHHTSITASQSA